MGGTAILQGLGWQLTSWLFNLREKDGQLLVNRGVSGEERRDLLFELLLSHFFVVGTEHDVDILLVNLGRCLVFYFLIEALYDILLDLRL